MRIPKAQRSSGVLSTSDSASKILMRGIEPVLDVVLHIFPSKHLPWLDGRQQFPDPSSNLLPYLLAYTYKL